VFVTLTPSFSKKVVSSTITLSLKINQHTKDNMELKRLVSIYY
jgi:hypothetical protein